MASILTNSSAMSALSTLRSIASSMESTQNSISTGMKVSKASDNAAYWSISTTMKSDNMALSAVTDALGVGAAKVDTAYAGMESAIDVVKEIKVKLVAAQEQGVDKEKIQEEITQLQEQLKSIAESASFNGQNWLANEDGASVSVITGFVRASDNTVSVKSTTVTLDDTNMLFQADATTGAITTTTGILGANGAASTQSIYGFTIDNDTDATALGNLLTDVETALTSMTSAAAKLGSISSRIELQTAFSDKLSDAIEKGVGRLVDADMNEESTRLKALQTQQQLAIQALSIANSDSQNILSLFR
ncbi:MAG: flagellin [Allorhizobium sp.]|uniref:Flagellin n=1 Tax=Rhizobium rosettiformans TaxID=1368430 RepID=A0ABX7EV99_9HYPH|nr:flagellin [Rhizobium rosettiformans]ODS58013.1 MAG: flagellin [Agrobacterium sp. SCN 61-19]QRF51788.1 flagellin [Rhizobium rosettiformans]